MIYRVLVVVGVVVTIVINALANIVPFNNLTTEQISNSFDVYFVPAGYVFSIWGVIYLGLLAYAIYQVLPGQRENGRLQAIAWPFLLSCVANSTWIFFWHYGYFALTMIMMVVLLLSLIAIYLRLYADRNRASASEKWLVYLPFSIYLGWVSVATIANATALLDYWQWNGWGISPEIWAMIMLAVGSVLAGLVSFTWRDAAYLLVLVWAFAGIGVEQASSPLVANTAWAATVLVVVLLVVGQRYSKITLPRRA